MLRSRRSPLPRVSVLTFAALALASVAASAQPLVRLPVSGLQEFSEFGTATGAGSGVLAVGAPGGTDAASTGAVVVYTRSGEAWAPAATLAPPDVVGGGYVGGSVAVSPNGTFVIAGAPLDQTAGIGTGAAFVWRRDAASGAWFYEGKLVAADAEAFDEFGQAVDVSDDGEAVVGSPFEGDGPTGGGGGAAYVFRRDAATGTWAQVAKLQPASVMAGDTFGRAVAISGGVVAVGRPVPGPIGLPQPPTSPGYVHLFARDVGGPAAWGAVQTFTGEDSVNGDFFGGAVALRGGWLAVGANQDQDAGPVTGAVYLFAPASAGGAWTQRAKLVPVGATTQDGIGFAVALDPLGLRVVFSAMGDDDAGDNAGAVYVYDRTAFGWEFRAKLAGPGPDGQARFGWSVAAPGEDVAVGANTDSGDGLFAGAAYTALVIRGLNTPGAPGAGALTLSTPQPHPAHVGATLALTGTGAYEARVVDALGRTVAPLGSGVLAPGQAAPLVLPALAPGVYAVVAEQAGARAVQRVVIAR